MDNRAKNKGTKGNKGGRPSKADEHKLIEKLTPLMPQAYKALQNALKDEEQWAVKLTMEYFYGKPKQSTDITTNGNDINISPIQWVE